MGEVLNVQGMSCNSCVNSIQGSVGQLTGVSSVQVDVAGGKVTVDYDNTPETLTVIKETIEEQGYDVI